MKVLHSLLVLLLSSSSFADDSRDDAVFGETSTPKKEESSIHETTTIGGRLSVDSVGVLRQGAKFSDTYYGSGATLYTYLDASPNDETRAFVRMRAIHPDPSLYSSEADAASPRLDLDETWIKIAAWDKRAFFTIGRQHVKWGTGRFWNPSDVLAPSAKDPLAVYDYRLGSNLVKFHYPLEKEGSNLYVIADVDHLNTNNSPGIAVRAEILIRQTEWSVTGYHRDHKKTMLAFDLSKDIGPFDWRGEFVASKNNSMNFYKTSDADNSVASVYSRKDKWIFQFIEGMQYLLPYGDQKHIQFELEYFFNDMGYRNRNLEYVALKMGDAQRLYAGRQYLGFLMGIPKPGNWQNSSIYLSSLYNMSDSSGLNRMSLQTRFFKEALLELWASSSYGADGEFSFATTPTRASSQAPGGESLSTTFATNGVSRALGASVSMNF